MSIDNIVNGFDGVDGAKDTNIVHWMKDYDNGLEGKQRILTDGKDERIEFLKISSEEIERIKEIADLFDRVKSNEKYEFKSMKSEISSWNPYDLLNYEMIERNKEGIFDTYNDGFVKVYCKKCVKYIDTDIVHIKDDIRFNKFKILFSKTWGNYSGKYLGGAYSNIIIASPNEICSDTYIECGCFDDINSTKNTAKYMMTRFARAIMLYYKLGITSTKEYWSSVPVQDYSEPFWDSDNIDDIDEGLFEKYNVPEGIKEKRFNSRRCY